MPNIILPKPEDLPAEIVRRKQWVGWRYVTKKSSTKPTKQPLQASGDPAKTDNSDTWTSFFAITKTAAASNGRFAGVGFVFAEKDAYAGVDLDNCLNEDGSVMAWAGPLLARFADTYMEISPSGRGIKIWCQGRLPKGRKIEFQIDGVKCGVEAYSWGRFFTCTGQRWQNAPLSITPHQTDIETALEVAAKLAAPTPAASAAAPASGPIAEGGRHESLKKMGVRLRVAGMAANEIEAALLAFNAHRCSPPKPENEVRDIARWVGEHQIGGVVDPATLPKLVGMTGEEVYTQEVKDVQPVVEGFIYPGCSIFCGRPKQGKSFLMLQAAIGVVGHSTIAGRLHVRQPGQVLYCALEEISARTTRRMRKIAALSDLFKDITFIYRKDIEAAANGGIVQIENFLKDHPGVRLVVIDTLMGFMRLERKKTSDLMLSDYNMIQPLQELAGKYDVAIVIVDHSRKLGGDPIDILDGTSGKSAAVDAVMTLQRQADGTYLLTVIHRDAEEQVFQMRFHGDRDPDQPFGWWVMASGEDATTSAEMQEVIDLLKELPLGPAALARQLGRKEGTIRMRLKRLIERGRVNCDKDGKYHAL